jgi:thiol-disulfide isomerase/thioredoxin
VPADKGDVLVVIGAKWCGPCMRMYPQWKTLRALGYRVVYIDYDRPTWDSDKPEDEAIVREFAAKRDKSVPDVYVYNTETKEIVEEWHQLVRVPTIKEHLWKPSSSKDYLPEFLR